MRSVTAVLLSNHGVAFSGTVTIHYHGAQKKKFVAFQNDGPDNISRGPVESE